MPDSSPTESFLRTRRTPLFPDICTEHDFVQRGPDWQWADQDGGSGHQGTVMMVKEWKTQPNAAVRVKWDDKVNDNTYRYGGENCYDVIL